jgi:hypothetical protein
MLLSRLLREAPQGVARALEVITESLANFVQHALAAGADGVFLSVRDDWVDTPENGAGIYDWLVRPGDLKILAACAQGSFNLLHVCGGAIDFRRFADYPVHAINWADRYAGPAIADLQALGVTHVALEATGVLWKPVWNVLEGRFTLLLVNPRQLVPRPRRGMGTPRTGP